MKTFQGRLVSPNEREPIVASVSVDEEWVKIWSPHRRIGAWHLADVTCERITVFRFHLDLNGMVYTFSPDDPGGFSDSLGAVVDLRPKSRFGLGERVKAAKEERAALATAQATEKSDD